MVDVYGRNILCLTSHDWYGPWNVPHQVMSRLANTNNILFYSFPSVFRTRKNTPPKKPAKIEWISSRMALWNPGIRVLPAYRFPRPIVKTLNRINKLLFGPCFENVLKTLGWREFIIWVYDPRFLPFLEKFKDGNLFIYDCIDDWAGYFDGQISRNIQWIDQQTYCAAKLVFAGSHNVMNRNYRCRDKYLVPFGVDARHFATATQPDLACPQDMEKIKGPVMGIIGVLDKRTDISLLQKMATDKPEWQIVLVGPIVDTCRDLFVQSLNFPNVHFLGPKTLEELPAYLKKFQVCMIPYVIDNFTKSINPLKLYEYFASGKPVVSTPVPECFKFHPLVRIAAGPDEFISNAADALKEKDQDRQRARIQIAFNNTWDNHVRIKTQTIRSYL